MKLKKYRNNYLLNANIIFCISIVVLILTFSPRSDEVIQGYYNAANNPDFYLDGEIYSQRGTLQQLNSEILNSLNGISELDSRKQSLRYTISLDSNISQTPIKLQFVPDILWETLSVNSLIKFVLYDFDSINYGILTKPIKFSNDQVDNSIHLTFEMNNTVQVDYLDPFFFKTSASGVAISQNIPMIITPLSIDTELSNFVNYMLEIPENMVLFYSELHMAEMLRNNLPDSYLTELTSTMTNLSEKLKKFINITSQVIYPLEYIQKINMRQSSKFADYLLIFFPMIIITEIIIIMGLSNFIEGKRSEYILLYTRGYSPKVLRNELIINNSIIPTLAITVILSFGLLVGVQLYEYIYLLNIILPYLFTQFFVSLYLMYTKTRKFNENIITRQVKKPPSNKLRQTSIRLFILTTIISGVNTINIYRSDLYRSFENDFSINNYYVPLILTIFVFVITLTFWKLILQPYSENLVNGKLNLYWSKKFMLKKSVFLVVFTLLILYSSINLSVNEIYTQYNDQTEHDQIGDYTLEFQSRFDPVGISENEFNQISKLPSIEYYLSYYKLRGKIEGLSASQGIRLYVIDTNQSLIEECYMCNIFDFDLMENNFLASPRIFSTLNLLNSVILNNQSFSKNHFLPYDYKITLEEHAENFIIMTLPKYLSSFQKSITSDSNFENFKSQLFENKEFQTTSEQLMLDISDVLGVSIGVINIESVNEEFTGPFQNFVEVNVEIKISHIALSILISGFIFYLFSNSSVKRNLDQLEEKYGIARLKPQVIKILYLHFSIVILVTLVLGSIIGLLIGLRATEMYNFSHKVFVYPLKIRYFILPQIYFLGLYFLISGLANFFTTRRFER